MTSQKVLVGGDFNGHVGSDTAGFEKVQGGLGIGQINEEGWDCWIGQLVKGLRLMNTCFQKRKSGLITFRSGYSETMINYIIVEISRFQENSFIKEYLTSRFLLLLIFIFLWPLVHEIRAWALFRANHWLMTSLRELELQYFEKLISWNFVVLAFWN